MGDHPSEITRVAIIPSQPLFNSIAGDKMPWMKCPCQQSAHSYLIYRDRQPENRFQAALC
ncbi:hypothetical protein GCWU000324_03004 [Kingella oralis ATCC 51147]|uniref:Uncharacterized protein n=1 Tax=Kingella oralis ATCC 51147 TaxID=629741 RepID=C4GMR8_9NEIS|nr:hypothetical protein GCWU000324_03004 [Kingella oralis ATCC 51147]